MQRLIQSIAFFAAASLSFADTPVLTYHNDVARTGQQTNETTLTLSNVNSTNFGKLFSQSVDGQMYAQPLYVPNVTVGASVHNIVIVATEHDSVYAFDADDNNGANANPLWHVSFLSTGTTTVTTVPSSDTHCSQITSEIGITATPVVDSSTNTVYVVAMTKEVTGGTTTYVHRLHALDITSGAERSGSPVAVQASVTVGGTTATFVPLSYKARPGLLLLNGMVYTAWSSHCDIETYYGWLIGYHTANLAQAPVIFNTAPTGKQGALWASGAGPAADLLGNIYLNTANGLFDGGPNYGDSFLKVSTSSGLSVVSSFTPGDQANLAQFDTDLGSGGVLVLPDVVGNPAGHLHLLVGAGKEGTIYLTDRDALGGYNTTQDNVVGELVHAIGASFGMPAYFNGSIYYGGSGDSLKAFSISSATLSTTPTSHTTATFSSPGITPSVSANGSSNGIVWGIENAGGQIALHALNAGNLGQELYNSGNTGGRDSAGGYVKFTVPTIANGKVYTAGTALTVFGELGSGPPPPPAATPKLSPNGGNFKGSITVTITDTTPGAIIHYTTNGSTPTASSTTYPVGGFSISASTTVKAIAVASGYNNSAVASANYKHIGPK